jgi:hypothetical protein
MGGWCSTGTVLASNTPPILMITAPLYIATEQFGPADSERWRKYIEWAKIPALDEVVTLDKLLCPRLVRELAAEDWDHIVNEDFRLDYFYHLDYLLTRIAHIARRNVLGLYRNPGRHITEPPESRDFVFIGYDLIEEETQISALTNCGGFPKAYSNEELNRCGLISDFSRAEEVRRLLPTEYPEEAHANCELYAIWRLNEV